MNKHIVNAYQNTSMLIISSFLFQLMFLPVLINTTNGPTSWISIVLAGLLGTLLIAPIMRLQQNNSDKTILDICNKNIPKFFVKLVGCFYIILFIIASSLLLKDFSEQVKMFMLPKTSNNVVILIILLTSSYATQKGINTISQIAHITVMGTLIPLLLVTAFSTANANLSNIFPIWPLDIVGILKGVPIAFGSFFGFYLLLFSNAYVRRFKDNGKQNRIFFTLSAAVFIFCYMLIIFKFGRTEAGRLMFPFSQILKFLNIPGSFIENLEAIGISLVTVCAFVSLSITLYFTNLCLQKTLGTEEDTYFIYIQTPIIYVLAGIMPGMNIVQKYIYIPVYIFSVLNIIIIFAVILLDRRKSKALK